MTRITIPDALAALARDGVDYSKLISAPAYDIALYRPIETDPQQPHQRDEAYIIATGSGRFVCDGAEQDVAPGDLLFVPAGVVHRFFDFSADFSTWVIFFGAASGLQD